MSQLSPLLVSLDTKVQCQLPSTTSTRPVSIISITCLSPLSAGVCYSRVYYPGLLQDTATPAAFCWQTEGTHPDKSQFFPLLSPHPRLHTKISSPRGDAHANVRPQAQECDVTSSSSPGLYETFLKLSIIGDPDFFHLHAPPASSSQQGCRVSLKR